MPANTSSDNSTMSTAAAKTTKKSVAKAVEAPVAVAAPVAAAAPKVTKKAKAAESVAPVAVAAPVTTVNEPATPSKEEVDVAQALTDSLNSLESVLGELKSKISAATATLKTIEKQAARVIKKAERKRKSKSATTEGAAPANCIFTKPVKISDELCSFLGVAKDTQVSRSQVTKGVMAYARSHNLMDKQTIKADITLRKLLTLNEGDALTILNLQRFLRRHYIKAAPVAA
jgi:chromatin remodeling complex protein RSC6